MRIHKEIPHPSHPQHKLKLVYTTIPFICDGCQEAGIGPKYSCERCEFDLHKVCAMPSPIITHPFRKNCKLRFHPKPPGEKMRICDACTTHVQGFVYHCKCGFDLHPCCANLPQVLGDGKRNLYQRHKLSSSCNRCGNKGPGWSYRSQCKSYNLHVSCVKEWLAESWEAKHFNVDMNKVREMQTRIPSLGTLITHHGGREGKVKKCCKTVGWVVRLLVSAILGDPTAMIAAVGASFMAK